MQMLNVQLVSLERMTDEGRGRSIAWIPREGLCQSMTATATQLTLAKGVVNTDINDPAFQTNFALSKTRTIT